MKDDMRVLFSQDFDWTPPEQPLVTIAALAGEEKTVRRAMGEAAVAAGKGQEVPAPKRKPYVVGEAGPEVQGRD